MSKSVIIIGGGGHAKVLCDSLRQSNRPILGFTDTNHFADIAGMKYLGNDQKVFSIPPKDCDLVLGVGSTTVSHTRQKIYEEWLSRGYTFANVIHPSVVLASDISLGNGVQIMAGSIIQTGTSIGDNTIVNTKVSVDHDCQIGSHVHIAPGATLCGNVSVGNGSHIGAGATILQNLSIGPNELIRAQSLQYSKEEVNKGSLVKKTLNQEGDL